MCGRFESKRVDCELIDLFNEKKFELEVDDEIEKRTEEDIKPNQKILSIMSDITRYAMTKVNWGIKFPDKSHFIFNSLIVTITFFVCFFKKH
jgi:putative SOS response-associated peptidase YedK